MARSRIKLNHAGLAAILKGGPMQALTRDAAEQVAGNVRGQGILVGDDEPLPVKVTTTTTDRAHANVTLAHPAGAAVQAKHGALTKAARQAGLDVKGK